jgi:hypothetical protein
MPRVRIPRGLHPYAGGLPNYGQLRRWAAPLPIGAYVSQVTRVPLNDGQAQSIVPGSGSLTLTVGPSGLGTVWYPAAVTVFTTTGILDTSSCSIYAGPAGLQVPTTLLGTVSGGGSVLAMGLPPLPVGWYLTAVWSGAVPGDLAAINITGSKDARAVSPAG